MQTTTLRTIRADFRAQIESLAPGFPEHQDALWSYIDDVESIPGADLRRFTLEFTTGAALEEFVHGDGLSYSADLAVHVSYAGLPRDVFEDMRDHDARQLSLTLIARYEPTLAGLISVLPLEWVDGDGAETGRAYGYHPFEVRYFAAHAF